LSVFVRGAGAERSGEDVDSEVGETERVELDEREGVEGCEGMSVVSSAVEALVWRVCVAVTELAVDAAVDGREEVGRGGASVHW
jgi:hypothetical protein